MKKRSAFSFKTVLMLVLCLSLCQSALADVLRLPDGLKVIEEEAFYGDTSLDEVVLPEGVEEIGARAFAESSLTKINLPSSLQVIADTAFDPGVEVTAEEDTDAYDWAVIHDYIDMDQVSETPGFEFVFDESTGTIKGYNGSRTMVCIPSSIGGIAVAAIASDAFSGNTAIKGLVIPPTVTSIGLRAFKNCTGLKVVSSPISWNVSYISSDHAFYGCALKEFRVAGEPTEIPEGSFNKFGFSSLEKVVLPDTITSIGNYAFQNCSLITSLTIGDDEGSLNLPDGLTSIGVGAFRGCAGLTDVTFPYGLTTIGSDAFAGCTGLTCDLIIPPTVTSIGLRAFKNCTGLKIVSSPISWNVSYISSDHAFYGCALKEFRVAGEPTEIPEGSFNKSGFSSLEKVVLPDTITSIGHYAFQNCSLMTSLTVGDDEGSLNLLNDLTTIGAGAFSGCAGLSDISLPYGLTIIGSDAFAGCTGLTCDLIIPPTVTSIGLRAFKNCTGLKVVSSPISWNVSYNSSDHAFYGCALKEFRVAGEPTEIPEGSFNKSGFSSLEKVVLPDTITSIGHYAFQNCSLMTSLTVGDDEGSLNLPDGLTSIGIGAFKGCAGLTDVTFPYGLTTIGSDAFAGCTGLTCDLIIPPTVTSIGLRAFKDCTGLKVVSSPISWNVSYISSDHAFYGCVLTKFYVVGNPTEIPSVTFNKSQFQSLRTIMVPPSVTAIGSNAFAGCDKITAIYCDPDSYSWDWFAANGYGDALIECTDFHENIKVSKITISPATAEVEVNSIVNFSAETLPAEADDSSVSWIVINGTGEGYINQHGAFIALSPGTVTIKAIANDGSNVAGKAEVTCVAEQTGMPKLEISRNEWNIPDGNEATEELRIQSADSWALSGVPNWMTVSQSEGTGDAILAMYVSENTGEAREATITFSGAGLTRTLMVHQDIKPTADCAVTSISVSSATVSTGDVVTFTVSVKNADQIVLVADNVEYDQYPVTGSEMKISRKFTLGGDRTITFRPYLNGEAGQAGTPIILVVEADDPPSAPVVRLPEHAYVWQDALIEWDEEEYADQYTLILSKDGTEYVRKTFGKGVCSYLIRGNILKEEGSYTLLLLATGKGWNQSETGVFLTVEKPSATFTGTMSKNIYMAGENPAISIQNPDGYRIAIRISDENGNTAYLPEDGGTLNNTSLNDLSFAPLSSGQHTIVILSWPTEQRGSDVEAWCQSEPITFTVDSPVVKLMLGDIGLQDNFLTSECNLLTATAYWGATRVTFSLDDSPITVYDENRNPVTEITTYKTKTVNNKEVRTFTCYIDNPSEGLHEYKAYAFDENGLSDDGGYRFYAVTPATAEGEIRWPSENDVPLLSTPAGKTRKKLAMTDQVTVLGSYGTNLTYVSCGGVKGFVQSDKLLSMQPVNWAEYKLTTVEIGSEPQVSYPGGSQIELRWLLNSELPAGASYCVRATKDDKSTTIILAENYKEKTLKIQPNAFGEGTWTVFVTVERDDSMPPGTPYIPSVYPNARLMRLFARKVVILKDAATYMKYMVNLDESSLGYDFYQERILSYATILLNCHQGFTTGYTDDDGVFHEPVDIGTITDSYVLNTYGALFNNGTTIVNLNGTVSRLYIINSIMNTLSPEKESDGLMIPISFINDYLDLAKDWYDAKSTPLDIITSTVNILAMSGKNGMTPSGLIAELNKVFSPELGDALGDVGLAVSVVSTIKDLIVASVQALSRAYCYSQVDHESLDNIANNLINSGNEELRTIGNALKDLKQMPYIAYYCACQLGVEGKNAGQELQRSAIFYAMGLNPYTAVIAASIQGAVAFNNIVLATDEIQESAHQVKWAVDTADKYSTTLSKCMSSFRTNPVTGYNDLVKACQTMLVLVHSEMKAMAKMSEAVDSALWTKFWNAVTRTDKYKIYAQKATDLMPTMEGYVSGVFRDYRTKCLTKLNANDYLEWSNPLK